MKQSGNYNEERRKALAEKNIISKGFPDDAKSDAAKSRGDKESTSVLTMNQPERPENKIDWVKLGAIATIATMFIGLLALYMNYSSGFVKDELYVSTQTVRENKPTTKLEYLDLDGRGQLVPLPSETMEAAMQFGKAKGEENKIYMHRVVVMALDPSIRYTEGNTLGNTFKPAYDPNKLYIFYIPDGTDITDEDASINIIPAGNKTYRVKLLSIDGRRDDQSRMSYIFRVEEITE